MKRVIVASSQIVPVKNLDSLTSFIRFYDEYKSDIDEFISHVPRTFNSYGIPVYVTADLNSYKPNYKPDVPFYGNNIANYYRTAVSKLGYEPLHLVELEIYVGSGTEREYWCLYVERQKDYSLAKMYRIDGKAYAYAYLGEPGDMVILPSDDAIEKQMKAFENDFKHASKSEYFYKSYSDAYYSMKSLQAKIDRIEDEGGTFEL